MSVKREEIDPELLSRSAYTSIGLFNVSEGRLIVSDPSYEVHPALNFIIENATPGHWFGVVKVASEDYGNRIAELIGFSVHTSAEGQACIMDGRCSWEQQQTLGVDSGMMGIFDAKFYKVNGAVKGKDLDAGVMSVIYPPSFTGQKWFAHCAHITKRENSIFGVDASKMPGGMVSRSGFGDGRYEASTYCENELVCGVKIEFINDDIIAEILQQLQR